MEVAEQVRPAHQTVAIVAAELALRLHQLFPDAVIKPSEPYEDEDICIRVYGPWEGEGLKQVREQLRDIMIEIYDKHEVEVIVNAFPLSYLPGSE